MSEEREPGSPAATKAVLTLFSVAMLGIAAGTGVLLYRLVVPPASKAPVVGICEEGKPGTCAEGEICQRGRCTAWDQNPPKCELGQSCDAHCTCTHACRAGFCVKSESPAGVCAAPEVQSALRQLVVACESAGGRGIGCEPSRWRDFVMNDARFDEIITNFPDKVTIHFPAAKPEVVAPTSDWPTPAVRAHYLEELRRMRPALDAAKLIFVVGRASRGGPPEQNERLGFVRMHFVRTLMKDLYTDSEAGRAALDPKVLNFTLGESRQLPASFFSARLQGRVITWDAPSHSRLTNAIMNPSAITKTDKWWAVSVVNQMAFVIAVPCDGGDVVK